jgi:hypothetical protein
MGKLISIFLIFCLMILFQNVFAHVGLDNPVGGENFQSGEVVEIRWHIVQYHGSCDWDLLFSNDGGSTWQSIFANLPESQLSYNWTVPNIETDSGQVKVVQDNATGMDYSDDSGNFIINISTGIKNAKNHIDKFVLYSAYPNPFNPSTTIRYALSNSSRITLKVYNILGEKIRTIVDEFQSPGEKSVMWDGTNNQGKSVGSGVYLYQLQSGNEIKTKKMTLLK